MKTSDTDAAAIEVLPIKITRDSLGRRTLDGEQSRALPVAFERSGLSRPKFAEREGLTYSTFCGRIQKRAANLPQSTTPKHRALKSPMRKPSDGTTPTMGFRELRVAAGVENPTPVSSGGLTVVLPGGVEVRGCDAPTAAELIRALREVR
jgi:hypothetical protein